MNQFEIIRFHPVITPQDDIQSRLGVLDDSHSLEHAYQDAEGYCVMIYRATEQRQLESLAHGVAQVNRLLKGAIDEES